MWTSERVYGPTPEQIREQRRYEIARDCMASAYADPELFTDMAARVEHAVKAADALLAELERTDGVS